MPPTSQCDRRGVTLFYHTPHSPSSPERSTTPDTSCFSHLQGFVWHAPLALACLFPLLPGKLQVLAGKVPPCVNATGGSGSRLHNLGSNLCSATNQLYDLDKSLTLPHCGDKRDWCPEMAQGSDWRTPGTHSAGRTVPALSGRAGGPATPLSPGRATMLRCSGLQAGLCCYLSTPESSP